MKRVVLFSVFVVSVSCVNAQQWKEKARVVASDRGASDFYGSAMDVYKNQVIVGAYFESHDTNGQNAKTQSGSAYIVQKNGNGQWSELVKLVASDRQVADHFGKAVTIWGDYAVVGAPRQKRNEKQLKILTNAGACYIYERDTNGNWGEVQKIVPADREAGDNFGTSVSLDSNILVVGAPNESHDVNGKNTAASSGSVYIYKRNSSGVWEEHQKVTANVRHIKDYFGEQVDIHDKRIIISAFWDDYDADDKNKVVEAGAAYIFEENKWGNWVQQTKLVAPDREYADKFGKSVGIYGENAVIGAMDEDHDTAGSNKLNSSGSAYVFVRNSSGNWVYGQKIVASDRTANNIFGISTSIYGETILVGARSDYDTTGSNYQQHAGAAYVFTKNSKGDWVEDQKIIASGRDEYDNFGAASATHSGNVAVGAYTDEHGKTGDTTKVSSAGTVYIFDQSLCTPTSSRLTVDTCGSFTWKGIKYTSNTVIKDTLVNGEGCDSIITLSLTINQPSTGIDAITTCDSHTWIDGKTYTSSNNTATYTMKNAVGCDSTITLNLTINTSNTSIDTVKACDTYRWIDGRTYTASNNRAKHVLKNAAGCDSTIFLHLTINRYSTSTDKIYACDSYTWIDNKTYTTSSRGATFKLTNDAGCDSIVTLDLTINSVSDVSTKLTGSTITASNTNGIYQWLDCDNNYKEIAGEKGRSFAPSKKGNYAVEILENDCKDTSECVNVNTISTENVHVNDVHVYPNPNQGWVGIYNLDELGEDVTIVLTDLSGRVVLNNTVRNASTVHLELPLRIVDGTYFIYMQSADKAVRKQIILMR